MFHASRDGLSKYIQKQNLSCPNCRSLVNMHDFADLRSEDVNELRLTENRQPRDQSQLLKHYACESKKRTTKQDIYLLLDIEGFWIGDYLLPPLRNVKAQFLRQVFRGEKKLLKKSETKPLGKVARLKPLSTLKLLDNCPIKNIVYKYLPDVNHFVKLDRNFVPTVNSQGPQYSWHWIRYKCSEMRTKSPCHWTTWTIKLHSS